jgi:hypothetical protein
LKPGSRNHTVRTRLSVALSCVAALAAVSACTSEEGSKSKGDETRPSVTKDAGSKVPSGDSGGLKDPVGAASALGQFTCKADKSDVWSARGVLTNTSKKQVRYFVTVAIIRTKTSEVLESKGQTFTVAASGTQKVSLHHLYKGAAKGASCVPRVVAGG